MIDEIYNKDVLRLAANISKTEPLDLPDAHVLLRSPLCGSTIEIDIRVETGSVVGYGYTIKACALGQASASVLTKNVIGKDAEEIKSVRDQLESMLLNNGEAPHGDWSELSALAPAKAAKSRHGAILMPFDAVLKAFKELK